MKFKKKPVVIEATQWFKNGDHPQDHAAFGKGDRARYDEYVHDTEGVIVRRFRRPDVDGKCLASIAATPCMYTDGLTH